MGSTGSYGPASEPIAIVGLSCKLAGEASSADRFWEMLAAGRSAWSEIPPSRFNLRGAYHPKFDKLNTLNIRGGHFLEQDLALFDAPFFSLSAEAASSMDPQIRLQLESVYEALENAGFTLPEVAGTNTAVYAAMFGRDYHDGIIRDEDNLPRFLATGTGDAMLSNRVSHFYDLRGPSFTLDTGCSGGLVALHQGVQTLRTRETNMALICASNLYLNPDVFKSMGSLGLVSPDGKSYTFDSRANGYGRGEGIATVVIKRLSDAIAARDPIRAVIRESALNQDGKTETITTPCEEAQVALMRDCYRRAGLDLRDTQYFEAHGTGTLTGDPIECRAIATVFKEYRGPDDPLRIGSVKTNVGHTEPTSGLASLIKVVLALEKRKIPPSVNFVKPNPSLALDDWRLRVVTELEDWPEGSGGIRRASINNFGYGGTNAHLIVESPTPWEPLSLANGHVQPDSSLDSQLFVFSARDEQVCLEMISNLQLYLKRNAATEDSEGLLRSIAYSLGQRRSLFPWVTARSVPVQDGVREAIRALNFPMPVPRRATRVPRIGMVFTGQGAQWYAMGRELVATYPIFEASLRETDRCLKALGATWSVIEELTRDVTETRVNDVEFSTPLCIAVQISLVRLLRSWGVKPVAVTSHSSGEIAAAYAVGALSCKSAMAVAYHRALLAANKRFQLSNKGAMVAVGMSHRETKSYLARLETRSGTATVACVNSPASTTVSGDDSAVTELEALARNDGIYTHRLKIETAFHSHHMSPVATPYRMALKGLLSPATVKDEDCIAFSSPVSGGRVYNLSKLSEPGYWVDSLLQPVQFVDALTDMILNDSDSSGANVDIILEVGPHTALGAPIAQILAEPEFAGLNLPCLGCLVRGTSAIESMHSLAASLLAEGLPLDLGAINFPRGRTPSIRVLSDLPSYPWNHQTRHWCESRFNKALRERSQPPHDLLGNIVLGTDLHNPSWRQILKLTDTPWVRDHIIQNSIIYPGAGFICLAIEAMRQLSEIHSKTSHVAAGYRLRDIDILQALVIPETDDGVEIQTSLKRVCDKNINTREWKQFEISSVTSDNRWTLHARGLIMLEPQNAPHKTAPAPRPARLSGYTRRFEGNDLYSSLRDMGIKHQKAFQCIAEIEQAGDNKRADSLLSVPDTSLPTDLPHRVLVHPTTLDAVLQTAYTPLIENSEDENGKVPRSIGSLWISSAISNEARHRFKAYASLGHIDARGLNADIILADYDDEAAPPVLEIRDAVYQSLGRNSTAQSSDDQWTRQPCMKIKWAPDISLLSSPAREHLKQQLSHPVNVDETRILLDLRRVCLYFISDALAALTPYDVRRLEKHHAKFHVWMQHQMMLAADGRLGPESHRWLEDTPEEREQMISEVRKSSVNGEMVCQVGPHLAIILRKKKTPLELMMEGNLLNRYYRHALKSDRVLPQAANILEYLVHKNPRARILEIGGGTGGFTRYTLPKIGTPKTGALAELYHFTDISPSFFEAARNEFAPWSDVMLFDKLDIEVDPASQGFGLGSYDIVIAAQVLHATTSMARTMSHVRKLMKPGGTLLLVETTQDQLDTEFAFGLLPGWWLSEEPQRALSPSLTVPFWDETLRTAGFSGIDFHVRDCESDEWYMMNVMTSTADPQPQPIMQPLNSVVLVVRQQAPCDQLWLNYLRSNLASAGHAPSVVELESAPMEAFKDKQVLFLGEVDQPLLHGLDSASLKRIQAMIKHSRGVLWVTRGGAVDCERPELALASGLFRSIRHEYAGVKYVTLDLDPNTKLWSCATVTAITQVFTHSFGPINSGAVNSTPYEFEYAERQGPERPLALKVGVPGLLDTLAFDDDKAAPPEGSRHPSDLIEIDPRAYGVNFRDVLVAMDQLEERIMGVDCAGIITRVGSRAAARGYAVGDHVFALLPNGGYGSRARTEWTNVMHMPPGMSFEHAASVPVLFSTVYLSFYKVARLQRGQTVLIHAGAGGTGQTAIQFAQLIGAEIYTTVGSPEKRALIMERYGIPADHIFSSRDASFAPGILKATGGRGVDVVLNSLAGPLLQESLNIVAPFGHFVEIGKRDFELNNHLEMRPFSRAITFSSFDLLALARHDGRLIHSALAEISYLLEKGTISPVHPISTYPLGDISKALRLLQSGKHAGKIVLTVSPQEKVRVLPRARIPRLRSDASYLLVGGGGGIGQSIAHWLVDRGARNLIILSRSAATNPAAVDVAAQLQPTGCRIKLVSCDASVGPDLSAALRSCADDLPPIRGVVQAAMVLKDSMFERMSFDDWQAALNPKVKVSWNLHNQFPRSTDLDFFILLSSMSGIYGYTTQSNYGAANAYEDALAHWRVSQGLPAVSVNLGPVKAVGFVAETAGTAERMTRVGHYPVTEGQVLRTLESAVLSPFDKQVPMGINQGPGPHWDPNNSAPLGRDARFRAMQYRKKSQRQATGETNGTTTSLATQLSDAGSKKQAEGFVAQAIAKRLAEIFMIPLAHIDAARRLTEYGLDSLGAVELRNMLTLQAAADVSIFDIMQSESLAALASNVTRKSTHVDTSLLVM
ncbi:type I polyketide synthase [Aspergillus mulundensis]|uniref:Polyketide synthase, putative (JCVI) n=1 Tax=Aspergillus mulundensis TaxID=1810919 RepID=A0A3D8SB38_9EURO|nr:Polyketide synthase, putative (JCVI) [Aspergillus mulundensis]RDW83572.1 Polyketide synthase, putative (JCVI) [Aspergillus mulundensis]